MIAMAVMTFLMTFMMTIMPTIVMPTNRYRQHHAT
jgi:hypothetical protein